MASEGIIQYCEVYKKSARHCPSQSIPFGQRTFEGYSKSNNSGAFKWYFNTENCLEYCREIVSSCSVCIRVCSFTKKKGFSHKIVKWFIRNIPQLNRFLVFMDELLKFGGKKDPREYWGLQ